MGSDYGFCSNFNSQVNEQIRKDEGSKKILIGRKLHCAESDSILLRMDNEEFEKNMEPVRHLIVDALLNLTYSKINIIYNHYNNTTDIQFREKQLYPVTSSSGRKNREDFVVEGDLNRLLRNLIITYVNYEVLLSYVFSAAAENLMRQNATTESLKRIDEIEEEAYRMELRAKREREFQKVIDSFIKMRASKENEK
jgi:F0F1-type ATP synthase gamma subunit